MATSPPRRRVIRGRDPARESVGGQFDASLKHAMAWRRSPASPSRAACSWSSRTRLNARSRGLSPYCPTESVLPMKPTPTTTLLPRCWPQRLRESSRQRGCWPIAGRCAAMAGPRPPLSVFTRGMAAHGLSPLGTHAGGAGGTVCHRWQAAGGDGGPF